MKFFNYKKYTYLFFPIIFTLPLVIFGINDVEEYMLGTFSTLIFWENLPTSLFTFFYDFYGPGTKIPIGSGPLFHPLNFFLFDYKIYYSIFIFSHLILQIEFSRRLLKIFKIKYNLYLLSIILVFCLPNILFALSDDWISCFFSYSFFPIIFYYFVKILQNQKFLSYLKFSLFFSFWILNGHLGHISTYIIFLFFYLTLSIQNLKDLKKIFNFNIFICFIFIILILSNYLFFLIRELSLFDGWRVFQGTYSLKNFIEIIFPLEGFTSSFGIYRLPGNPVLIYFCIFILIITFFDFLKLFLNKPIKFIYNNFFILFHKQICLNINFKFCFLFLLFLIFSLLPFLSVIPSVSAGYMARDIFLYIGIFIYFLNIGKIRNKMKIFINFLLIFYSFLFFSINVENKINVNENNFIVNKVKNSELINELNDLNLKQEDYSRIYLSPNLFSEMYNLEDDGLFAVTDLIKFNLAPFNGYFKYTSKKEFGDEFNIMKGYINSHYEFINNDFFLDLFKINFLLIAENEFQYLQENISQIAKKIKTSYDDLYLIKRKVINYSIHRDNIDKLKTSMENCKVRTLINGKWINEDSKLDCLLKNKNLFDFSNHKLLRLSNGVFIFKDIEKNNYPVTPFIFDKNWISNNKNIINLDNFLLLLNNDSELDDKVILSYEDNIRYFLKIMSIVSFLILMLYIIFYKWLKSFAY